MLCRPSHPGNIGAAARAMKTMGLSDLRLVAPEKYPAPEAQWLATLVDRWQALDSPVSERLSVGQPDATSIRRWIASIGRTSLGAFYRLAHARWRCGYRGQLCY